MPLRVLTVKGHATKSPEVIESSMKRVFGEGFRIFFLAAGVIGAVAGLLWTYWVASGAGLLPVMQDMPTQWHAHEMIFGYGVAAVGGFFLTAVPNWTNTDGAKTAFVVTVFGLWLVGRLAVWSMPLLPPMTVMVLDLLFVPVLAVKILSQLLKRPKPQNMVFLTMLCALWVANGLVHLEWIGATDDTAATGLRAGLLALAGLITVLGGRVTPAFTRNAMKRDGVPEAQWPQTPDWTQKVSMALALGMPWVVMIAPPVVAGCWIGLLGLVQIPRQARWRGLATGKEPLIWSLHLSMALLALGLILWGLATFDIGTETSAIHVLGIGAVGGMTVAVMSRAALGHTGRPLTASPAFSAVYALMAGAVVLRWIGQSEPLALVAAGVSWTTALVIFCVALWPIISRPRVDRG